MRATVGWTSLALLSTLPFLSAPEPARAQAGAAPAAKKPARKAFAGQATIEQSRQASTPFHNPDELKHLDFNELKLVTGTFPNLHPASVTAPDAFELLSYNAKAVGPTIRVRRGRTFHIHLKNELDPTTDPKPNPPNPPTGGFPPNPGAQMPHDLCTTNLHTHGLHVSPANNADNILDVKVGPKGSGADEFTFEYTVPADHPAGTFWYHPHRHGAVAYQLSNGLAGALIVDGEPDDGVPDLDDVPEIAAAKERIMVFQLYNYRTGPDKVGRIDASTIYNVNPDAYACTAIKFSGPPPADPDNPPQVTAINGVINPVIHLRPGEVQRWRLIHAAWDVYRNLSIYNDRDQQAAEMPFYEIALDGLATGNMVSKGAVGLAPGQRSDVLVQAPRLNPGERERTYHLYQDNTPATGSTHGRAQDAFYLAKIVVSGEPREMGLPDRSRLARYQPFAPIADEELNPKPSLTKLVFSATDGDQSKMPPALPHYTINGTAYDENTITQIRLNTAEEWTIEAQVVDGNSSHPFHIHVNPFQVVSHFDGKTTSPVNEWRDTLYVPEGESYTIRSRFRDFVGKTVIHCHILDHEDQGMMMNIEFIPPYQTPVVPQVPALKKASTPAPALKLADASGAPFDLAGFRDRKVALVFFQGAECAHCAGKLGDLVREARGSIGPDAAIVAVSSRRIADSGRTLRALGVSGRDRFHLLVDEGSRAFRDFGCYEGGPKHGLFLIDGGGVIRARYVGEAPFGDTREVVRRFRELTPTPDKPASE